MRSGDITRTNAVPLSNKGRFSRESPNITSGNSRVNGLPFGERSPGVGHTGVNRPCARTKKGPATRRKRKKTFITLFSIPMQGPAGLHTNPRKIYLIFLYALIKPLVELS